MSFWMVNRIFMLFWIFTSVWSPNTVAAEGEKISVGTLGRDNHKDYDMGESSYFYERDNRRDPFESLLVPKQVAPDPVKPSGPQKDKVMDWKLIGILSGMREILAMVESPRGRRQIVSHGSSLGFSGWKVKKITEETLTLEKVEQRKDGRRVSVYQPMTLNSSR